MQNPAQTWGETITSVLHFKQGCDPLCVHRDREEIKFNCPGVWWGISHHWDNFIYVTSNSHTETLHVHIHEPLFRLISFSQHHAGGVSCTARNVEGLFFNHPGLQTYVISSLTWITAFITREENTTEKPPCQLSNSSLNPLICAKVQARI